MQVFSAETALSKLVPLVVFEGIERRPLWNLSMTLPKK